MSARITGTIAGLAGLLWASGCLPLGAPPEGRHVVSGRADLALQFQPAVAEGAPARLLTVRPTVVPIMNLGGPVSIYAVSDLAPSGGTAGARLLVDDALVDGDEYGNLPFRADARGRLFISQVVRDQPEEPTPLVVTYVRVDLATDARRDYGPLEGFSISADRTRVLTNHRGTFLVHDLDDHETLLPEGLSGQFVGGDVFLVSTDGHLLRLRGPDGAAAPEVVASDVRDFTTLETARGPLLLLTRTTAVPTDPPARALFDVTTSTEMAVPVAGDPSFNPPLVTASPSGRFLLVVSSGPNGRQQSTLLDRDTGTLQTDTDLQGELRWRPGHDEVWIQAYSETGPTAVWLWRPGQAPVHVVDAAFGSTDISEHNFAGRPFTPDGHFWLASEGDRVLALRSTDDLAVEPFPLNTSATGVSGYWPLPDGRGISEVYATYQFHCDISLVDPVARTTRPLASNGIVVAVGAHRILALLNWVKGSLSGDLTLIDLDSGEATLLAESVFFVEVDRPRAELDRLPSGARVAYLVRNRIASPYDGIWVMTLP